MPTAEDIAAVEASLQAVQTAIARVQRLLASDPANAGLAATLATLQAQEFALQVRLANLKASAVVVAAPAAVRAMRKAARPAAPPSASAARREATKLARGALALSKVTLETVGDPKRDAPHRRTLKATRASKR